MSITHARIVQIEQLKCFLTSTFFVDIKILPEQQTSLVFFSLESHLHTEHQHVKKSYFKVHYNLQLVLKFAFGVRVATT